LGNANGDGESQQDIGAIKMSPTLKKFFLSIHEWVEQGCPEHRVFLKTCGLCGTLQGYAQLLNLEGHPLGDELDALLRPIDGTGIPFNDALYEYWKEQNLGTIYQNPHRLAFIKQQVEWIKNA
jgi:hypothetical protein